MSEKLDAKDVEIAAIEAQCPHCGGEGFFAEGGQRCCGNAEWECGGRGCTGPFDDYQQVLCEGCNGTGLVVRAEEIERRIV